MEKQGLLYPEESYYIIGLCYSIQNQIGPNQKERQYCDALELLLQRDRKDYTREYEIRFVFCTGEIGGNIVDFLFQNKILVDLKAKKYITKEDYKQMIRYLEAAKLALGIIVNFHGDKVVFKRVINLKTTHT